MTSEVKGGHVLAILLAFFGITIAVNVVFASYAISTFTGEDVAKPYLKGLDYNKTLSARSAQAALGWSAEIDAQRAGTETVVTVRFLARDGTPRIALDVTADLRRPTDATLDRTLRLEPAGDGVYRATVEDLAAGQWDVIARTVADNGTPFEATRRVVLR